MSFTEEVGRYFADKGIGDDLPQSEKEAVSKAILSRLPISLDPLSCFDEHVPHVDLDAWNAALATLKSEAQCALQDERYYLFVLAHPKSFLVVVPKNALLSALFDSEFIFSYAVFSQDWRDFLLEDHSGIVVGQGRFARLVDAAREAARE